MGVYHYITIGFVTASNIGKQHTTATDDKEKLSYQSTTYGREGFTARLAMRPRESTASSSLPPVE